MKSIVKKVAIYSMVGIMQVGFGASIIEASPLHNDGSQRIVQLDRGHDNDRQREHDRREREENQRHEREMRRHDHESDRDWHNRQDREKQRHDNTMNEIAAGLIGILIGTQIN
jgi:ABC-type Zn2+ transport system substrate-binding protein/surface adhesin